jgi:peptide/nickel transport system substrate-binding protein
MVGNSASPAARFKEAPMLAKLVSAGKLPPVEQRLPRTPFIRRAQEVGNYGGTLYDQAASPGGRFHLDGALIASGQETDNSGEIIRPYLCDRVTFNPDYTEFTFHIRQGLKWSDGVEVTADDVLWWWKYEQCNRTIFPSGPLSFKIGNLYPEFSNDDRLTFRIKFPTSLRPCLNISVSEWMSFESYFAQPAHWIKQFHIDFNPKADSEDRLFRWQMMTDASVVIDGPGATLHKEGRSLSARVLSPDGATFSLSCPSPSRPENPNLGYRQLAIEKCESGGDTRIVVQLSVKPFEASVLPLDFW